MKKAEKSEISERSAATTAVTGFGAAVTGATAAVIVVTTTVVTAPAWAIPVVVAGEVAAVGTIGYRLFCQYWHAKESQSTASVCV